jgi:hypothetical protein
MRMPQTKQTLSEAYVLLQRADSEFTEALVKEYGWSRAIALRWQVDHLSYNLRVLHSNWKRALNNWYDAYERYKGWER